MNVSRDKNLAASTRGLEKTSSARGPEKNTSVDSIETSIASPATKNVVMDCLEKFIDCLCCRCSKEPAQELTQPLIPQSAPLEINVVTIQLTSVGVLEAKSSGLETKPVKTETLKSDTKVKFKSKAAPVEKRIIDSLKNKNLAAAEGILRSEMASGALKTEVAISYDIHGDQVDIAQGDANTVVPPQGGCALVTHNHPNAGGPLSTGDIAQLVKLRLNEIRAVTVQNGTYSLKIDWHHPSSGQLPVKAADTDVMAKLTFFQDVNKLCSPSDEVVKSALGRDPTASEKIKIKEDAMVSLRCFAERPGVVLAREDEHGGPLPLPSLNEAIRRATRF